LPSRFSARVAALEWSNGKIGDHMLPLSYWRIAAASRFPTGIETTSGLTPAPWSAAIIYTEGLAMGNRTDES